METLPILNSSFVQPVERTGQDQQGTDAEDTAAASIGFGGVLQQAYAATAPSAPVEENPAQQPGQLAGEVRPATAAGLQGTSADMLTVRPMAVSLSTDELGISSLPLITEAGADDIRGPSGMGSSPSTQTTEHPSVGPPVIKEGSEKAVASPSVEGRPPQFGGPTNLSRISIPIETIFPDPLLSTGDMPAQDAAAGPIVRRLQSVIATASRATHVPVASTTTNEATSIEEPGIRTFTASTARGEHRAREINDGEKTIPLRMLLQRDTPSLLPEDNHGETGSRIDSSVKADWRMTETGGTDRRIPTVLAAVPQSVESTSIQQQPLPPIAAKTSSGEYDAKSQDPGEKGEGRSELPKPGGPGAEAEVAKPSQPFEIRSASFARSEGQEAHTPVLPTRGNSGVMRDAVKTHAGSNPLFDTAGLLMPEVRSSVLGQLVKEIAMQVHGEVSEMRMRLVPESLGEVVLKVRMENGNMHAQIDVQQASVKAVLDTSLPQLKQALTERGIEVQRLDVSCDGNPTSRESTRGEGERKRGHGHRRQEGVDGVEQYQSSRLLGYNTMEVIM